MVTNEEGNAKSKGHLLKCEKSKDGVQIDDTHCSLCAICSSVCPLDAIITDEKTGEVKLDIEKCQVCGICVSACPVSAIETAYYDSDSLINYVKKSVSETEAEGLLLTCRSNDPLPDKVREALRRQNLTQFISLRLPCVGRVSPEFLLKVLASGIKRIAVVPCEDYCRFKEGSKVGVRRFKLMQTLLGQLNLETALTVIEGLPRARIETEKCVSCGDCVEACSNQAIQLKSTPRVAELNIDKCSGCGACVVVCPTLAISIEGLGNKDVLSSISSSILPKSDTKNQGKKPAILVFCCQWSEFSALDETRSSSSNENLLFKELPCAARVESQYILEAFHSGFDGVLVAACKRNECKLGKGNEKAERRVMALKKLLSRFNLENRLEICFASPRYPTEFKAFSDSFTKALTKYGSLDLDSDKKAELKAAIEALNFERPRLILERSQILLEKGQNIFDEKVSQEESYQMLKPIEKEFMRRRIVLSMGEDALSVKEIAQIVGASPKEVLTHMISLERDGQVSVIEIQGNSPKYRRSKE